MVESESELLLWISRAGMSCYSCTLIPKNQGPVFLCAVAHLVFLKLLSLPLCSVSKSPVRRWRVLGGLEPWLMLITCHLPTSASRLPVPLFLAPRALPTSLSLPLPTACYAFKPGMGLGVSLGRVVLGTQSPWCLRKEQSSDLPSPGRQHSGVFSGRRIGAPPIPSSGTSHPLTQVP